jgi:hypothetical protein
MLAERPGGGVLWFSESVIIDVTVYEFQEQAWTDWRKDRHKAVV